MNFKPTPLRIFVYEHITGGGLISEALPAALAREGEIMLRRLINDLLEIPGVEIITTRDPRLPLLNLPIVTFTVRDAIHAENAFSHCVNESEATWLIAPEENKVLENLSREVMRRRCILVGSSPDAVAIAASKFATARLLTAMGIEVVPTYKLDDAIPSSPGNWVLKPDDAQGCVGTSIFSSLDEALIWARADSKNAHSVLQPFVSGDARSLSMLCRDGAATLLATNRQTIKISEGTFVYHGSEVNAFNDREGNLLQLANNIARAIPGLWGYVGVDYIDSDRGPVVLEINPRLTTSYVGLHESIRVNPAALVLNLFDQSSPFVAIKTAAKKVLVSVENCYVA